MYDIIKLENFSDVGKDETRKKFVIVNIQPNHEDLNNTTQTESESYSHLERDYRGAIFPRRHNTSTQPVKETTKHSDTENYDEVHSPERKADKMHQSPEAVEYDEVGPPMKSAEKWNTSIRVPTVEYDEVETGTTDKIHFLQNPPPAEYDEVEILGSPEGQSVPSVPKPQMAEYDEVADSKQEMAERFPTDSLGHNPQNKPFMPEQASGEAYRTPLADSFLHYDGKNNPSEIEYAKGPNQPAAEYNTLYSLQKKSDGEYDKCDHTLGHSHKLTGNYEEPYLLGKYDAKQGKQNPKLDTDEAKTLSDDLETKPEAKQEEQNATGRTSVEGINDEGEYSVLGVETIALPHSREDSKYSRLNWEKAKELDAETKLSCCLRSDVLELESSKSPQGGDKRSTADYELENRNSCLQADVLELESSESPQGGNKRSTADYELENRNSCLQVDVSELQNKKTSEGGVKRSTADYEQNNKTDPNKGCEENTVQNQLVHLHL